MNFSPGNPHSTSTASLGYARRASRNIGAFCRSFFDWYNQEHHHAGIGLMTPDQVHYGQADAIHAARQNTLDGAFSKNPERFVRKEPQPPAKPTATWINPPQKTLNIQA